MGLPSFARGVLSIAALALLSAPGQAQAFVCTPTEWDCLINLRWEDPRLSFSTEDGALSSVQREALRAASEAAAASWTEVSCSRASLQPGSGRVRLLPFTTSWPHAGSSHTAALTILRYAADGTIQKAEIDINYAEQSFVDASGACTAGADLQAVLTHEFGHVLALAHPCELQASSNQACAPQTCAATEGEEDLPTMWPVIKDCDPAPRELSEDDRAGICYLYPLDGADRSCAGLPVQEEAYLKSEGCACSRAQEGLPRLALLIALGLALRLLKRRSAPAPRP